MIAAGYNQLRPHFPFSSVLSGHFSYCLYVADAFTVWVMYIERSKRGVKDLHGSFACSHSVLGMLRYISHGSFACSRSALGTLQYISHSSFTCSRSALDQQKVTECT